MCAASIVSVAFCQLLINENDDDDALAAQRFCKRRLTESLWLRVPEGITFRLAVLAYRCQHNMAPRYLTAQLQQASNVGYRGCVYTLVAVGHAMFLAPNT